MGPSEADSGGEDREGIPLELVEHQQSEDHLQTSPIVDQHTNQ